MESVAEKIIKETIEKKIKFLTLMLFQQKIGKDQKKKLIFYLILLEEFI